MWQEGRTWTRSIPTQCKQTWETSRLLLLKRNTRPKTEPRPRSDHHHHHEHWNPSRIHSTPYSHAHKLIARILSATFSNDQLPFPTIHSFLIDFCVDEIPFVLFICFTLAVFYFLYCFCFSTSFCMGFFEVILLFVLISVICSQTTPLKPNIWKWYATWTTIIIVHVEHFMLH